MFHHFYDETLHPKGQGAINANELDLLLNFYKQKYNILCAEEWKNKLLTNSLLSNDVCLTFDDALKCQYDVALPVLKKHNLTAFWFIYTSPLQGVLEKLEVFRHFRTISFSDIDSFYTAFFHKAKEKYNDIEKILQDFNPDEYAKSFPFYTKNDKRFRYLRDHIFTNEQYDELTYAMIDDCQYDIASHAKNLWMSEKNIQELHNEGHIIGLHSHTHSTVLGSLSIHKQREEYTKNKQILEQIIKSPITTCSYPCNSYNKDTIQIMRELGIHLAFRANMDEGYQDHLEIPREDHANIIKMIKEENEL